MAEDSTVQDTAGTEILERPKFSWTFFFDLFGKKTISINGNLGAIAIFLFRSFFMIFHYKQIPAIVQQVYFIGAKSAQIVMLVGFFTGMVLGLQLYHVLVKFGSVGVLGTAVALSLIREMGPVLTAIMITARAGSAMTAEITDRRCHHQFSDSNRLF
jgi:phospholipid/cholesterol/gamma-HCH transport system permease protein